MLVRVVPPPIIVVPEEDWVVADTDLEVVREDETLDTVAADIELPDAVVVAVAATDTENAIAPSEHKVPGATGRHTIDPSTQ